MIQRKGKDGHDQQDTDYQEENGASLRSGMVMRNNRKLLGKKLDVRAMGDLEGVALAEVVPEAVPEAVALVVVADQEEDTEAAGEKANQMVEERLHLYS